jgi:hypothetical protein
MFGKEKKAREAEEAKAVRAFVNQEAPRPLTVLERLKKKRAEKIEFRKRLDREIAQLDHDITWVEVHPSSARILEFIAARFGDEETNRKTDAAPWCPEKTKPFY